MKRIIDSIGTATEKIGTAFDDNFTNKEELQAKLNEAQQILINAKQAIILAEANGNWLQRSWRPISGLVFVFIVFYNKFIAILFKLPNTVIEPQFWDLL